MEIVTVVLPASWSSALVNGDWSGLAQDDPEGAAQARAWQTESGLSVLSCGERAFSAWHSGLLTECLKYDCTPRNRAASAKAQ